MIFAWRPSVPPLRGESAPFLNRSLDRYPYAAGRESPATLHRPRPAARVPPAAADPRHESAVELASAHAGHVRLARPRGLGAQRAGPGPGARGDLVGPVRGARGGRGDRGDGP